MYCIKPSSNHFNASQIFDITKISLNLRVEVNKIINDMQHQPFFDPDLNHQHFIYLLNNRDTNENEFLYYLNDRIYHLNIPDDISLEILINLVRMLHLYI